MTPHSGLPPPRSCSCAQQTSVPIPSFVEITESCPSAIRNISDWVGSVLFSACLSSLCLERTQYPFTGLSSQILNSSGPRPPVIAGKTWTASQVLQEHRCHITLMTSSSTDLQEMQTLKKVASKKWSMHVKWALSTLLNFWNLRRIWHPIPHDVMIK